MLSSFNLLGSPVFVDRFNYELHMNLQITRILSRIYCVRHASLYKGSAYVVLFKSSVQIGNGNTKTSAFPDRFVYVYHLLDNKGFLLNSICFSVT